MIAEETLIPKTIISLFVNFIRKRAEEGHDSHSHDLQNKRPHATSRAYDAI